MMHEQEFERKRVCYEQNSEQARSLNAQMNHVPVLAMTLTGGLWFAAGALENINAVIRFCLLMFAGGCNLALIASVLRIRQIFDSYLEKMEEFHPESYANGKPRKRKVPYLTEYSVIGIYCSLMGVGSLLSFGGALAFYWPFDGGVLIGILCTLVTIGAWLFVLFNCKKEKERS